MAFDDFRLKVRIGFFGLTPISGNEVSSKFKKQKGISFRLSEAVEAASRINDF